MTVVSISIYKFVYIVGLKSYAMHPPYVINHLLGKNPVTVSGSVAYEGR